MNLVAVPPCGSWFAAAEATLIGVALVAACLIFGPATTPFPQAPVFFPLGRTYRVVGVPRPGAAAAPPQLLPRPVVAVGPGLPDAKGGVGNDCGVRSKGAAVVPHELLLLVWGTRLTGVALGAGALVRKHSMYCSASFGDAW